VRSNAEAPSIASVRAPTASAAPLASRSPAWAVFSSVLVLAISLLASAFTSAFAAASSALARATACLAWASSA